MFQSPLAQFPSIAQFSKAMVTPLSAARFASRPNTSLKRGSEASIGLPRMRPVKPAMQVAPNRWALSIRTSQPRSVSRSV